MKHSFTKKYSKQLDGNMEYRIYNLAGELLKKWKSNQIIEKIDIQNLPNGLYLLELQSQNGNNSLKFIKTN